MLARFLKNSYHQHKILLQFVVFVLLAMTPFVAVAFAQGVVVSSIPRQLSWQDVKNDPQLRKQITTEAKHLALNNLLVEVSQQSGVLLSLAPDSPLAQKLVTASISRMNLYDFMGAIARTYNAFWVKNNNQFILSETSTDAFDVSMSQIGNPLFYRYRDKVEPVSTEIITRRRVLLQKVLSHSDSKALHAEQGIHLSALPKEIIDSLKNEFQLQHAMTLLDLYTDHGQYIISGDTIRIQIKHDRNLIPKFPDEAAVYMDPPTKFADKVITIEVLNHGKPAWAGTIYGTEIEQSLKEQQTPATSPANNATQ